MRDKLISFGSCVSIFQPNFRTSFGTVSPVRVISGPEIPLLYSWSGSASYTSLPSIAFGTINRWRPDPNDPVPLNQDQWILWSTGTADIVRVKETPKSNIPTHWSTVLPTDLQNETPTWARGLIDEMIRKK